MRAIKLLILFALFFSVENAWSQFAAVLRVDINGNFDYQLEIGGNSGQDADTTAIPVITLGKDLTEDFRLLDSRLLSFDLFVDGNGTWGPQNWPENTTGNVDLSMILIARLQTLDEKPKPDNLVVEWSETVPYECEAAEGCPLGDTEFGSYSTEFHVQRPGKAFAGFPVYGERPKQEAWELRLAGQATASAPQHGTASVRMSGFYRGLQTYESTWDKLAAEFMEKTAGEFSDQMTVIQMTLAAGSGASPAEIAGEYAVQIGAAIFDPGTCAQARVTIAAKELVLLASTVPDPKIKAAKYFSIAGTAASVIEAIATCHRLDPPDFDIFSTFDPEDLLEDVLVPNVLGNDIGAELALAVQRDLRIALLWAAALDAYERYQGAQIIAETDPKIGEEAMLIQIENYQLLLDMANQLSRDSEAFYSNDAQNLFAAAGVGSDLDVTIAVPILNIIDEDYLRTTIGINDDADIERILNRVRRVLDQIEGTGSDATLSKSNSGGSSAASTSQLADPLASIGQLSELWDLVADYSVTDLSQVVSEGIGSEFWPSSNSETPISIDIRPYSRTNWITPNFGIIPVAILGSSEFDSLQVDIDTVGFGPNAASSLSWFSKSRDVNRDGYVDLVLLFRARDTGIRCEDDEATLIGSTYAGASFVGTDLVKTAFCR